MTNFDVFVKSKSEDGSQKRRNQIKNNACCCQKFGEISSYYSDHLENICIINDNRMI